jgi:hypothetical protein
LLAVALDGGPARSHRGDEQRDDAGIRAIGVAAAEDVEEAEPDGLDAVSVSEGLHVEFAGELRGRMGDFAIIGSLRTVRSRHRRPPKALGTGRRTRRGAPRISGPSSRFNVPVRRPHAKRPGSRRSPTEASAQVIDDADAVHMAGHGGRVREASFKQFRCGIG